MFLTVAANPPRPESPPLPSRLTLL